VRRSLMIRRVITGMRENPVIRPAFTEAGIDKLIPPALAACASPDISEIRKPRFIDIKRSSQAQIIRNAYEGLYRFHDKLLFKMGFWDRPPIGLYALRIA
jgi:hypothetical protein